MNLKCSPTPLQHQNDWPRGGCGAAAAASEVFLVPGQTWPASLMPSEASETFSGVFWSFRGLGNVQRRVLMLSEPSETFSGAF